MDGFDEISPTHKDKAAVIMSELMKTNVERVWVTSRPVEKERLEKELSGIAFSLKRLSRESQKEMIRNLWKYKADEETMKLDKFLRCVNTDDWNNPKIDLINLYELFFSRKLHIYLTEKQNADITNSSVLDNFEDLKQTLFNNLEKCSLVAILPPTLLESLHDKKIEEEIQPFLAKVQAGKDKTVIVMNVVDGKPQFVHRTFAEFLTARWFSRNFEFNRIVLEDILFKPEYMFVRKMFNMRLAKDYPLHSAVIRKDEKHFHTLLKEGYDVRTVDKGGRTVLHYIAESQRVGSWIKKLNFHNEASLHNKDSILQWTPLQCAIKSENWFIVDNLLKSNIDRSGLNMIRQRAHDTNYIAQIILESAEFGYLLLLEFLSSISVNIHQASSTDFPSPLHASIHGEQLEVVKWLIQRGADCNIRYSDGKTPLFYAVTESSLDVVRALVEDGGASVDIIDDNNETATDWAKRHLRDARNENGQFRSYNTGLEKTVEYLVKKSREDSKNNEA
jgi:hypothetical protein